MSGIKSNELQKLPNILGTDTILVDAASAGTARVPFDKAAEFFHKTLQEKGLSADNIFLADGETSLSTALYNKADKGPPEMIDFPFADGFSAYYPCYYTKDQFNRVQIRIGCANAHVKIPAGTSCLIGTLPEGFRPKGQVYDVGGYSSILLLRAYVNSAGEVRIYPPIDMDPCQFYFNLSFTAYF